MSDYNTQHLICSRWLFALLVALLILDQTDLAAQFALEIVRQAADVVEQGVQDAELFGQLVDALLKALVVAQQHLHPLLCLAGSHFGLLARLSHGDVVALPAPAVLVRALVRPFSARRRPLRHRGRRLAEG